MIKNLSDAKKYIYEIKKGSIKNPFQDKDGLLSLGEFSKVKDEKNFRIIVGFMAEHISKEKSGALRFFRKEPLAFIESLIMILDHGDKANYFLLQKSRGIKIKNLHMKRNQKFFQKLYGNCFFQE